MDHSPFTQLSKCRISGSSNLLQVLSLGTQALTGVFPSSPSQHISSGPLEMMWCPDSGLVQLNHSFRPSEMYGENYGYRSGLNQSMVDHLASKARYLERLVGLQTGDAVLDIGSNDGTTLGAYQTPSVDLIGIDPTAGKFQEFYKPGIRLVEDFFSASAFRALSKKKAKLVTSISMFYDLEDPVSFAREVESILADDGVWHLEQSYLPSMLRTTSYDTICHEHLEYYSLSTLVSILARADLKVIDVITNSVNGGSFAVTACKKGNASLSVNHSVFQWTLAQEERMGLLTPRPYRDFEERVWRHREDLTRLLVALVNDGKRVLGYGASTKGNVLLQFCKLGPEIIPAIAEVNSEKFGKFTPGSHIPIISEQDARGLNPDYFLVLPWHFKNGIIKREAEFLNRGGRLIFPFPEIEIV